MIKIDLTSAEKRKPIMGFGTSACWWSQNVADKSTADELAELLYGKNGLGLNIYRFNIGAGWDNDNCRVENPWRRCESFYVDENTDESENFRGCYDFEKDKNSYTFLKRCLKEGTIDTVILFANSPHYSLTSSGQASGSLMHHTCNLPMSNYGRFADIFLDITQHFIDDGVPVNYISPINEPQWKWGGKSVWQEGCHYEPKEVAAVFHTFAQKLEERNMSVKLYGPESGEKLNVFAFETPGGDYIIVAENEGGATDIEIKCGKENAEIYTTTQKRNFYREKETVFCGKLHLKAKSLTTARLYNGE